MSQRGARRASGATFEAPALLLGDTAAPDAAESLFSTLEGGKGKNFKVHVILFVCVTAATRAVPCSLLRQWPIQRPVPSMRV
jgi:hypothetical protein